MRDTIRAYLAADTTLMASLTGGLYAGGEISRQDTPAAFDANNEIEPCGLVALETQVPGLVYADGARLFFTVTCWERSGYTNIDAALERVYDLLHEKKIGVTSALWQVEWVEDSADIEDPGLLCPMKYGRYVAVRRR